MPMWMFLEIVKILEKFGVYVYGSALCNPQEIGGAVCHVMPLFR